MKNNVHNYYKEINTSRNEHSCMVYRRKKISLNSVYHVHNSKTTSDTFHIHFVHSISMVPSYKVQQYSFPEKYYEWEYMFIFPILIAYNVI